MDIRSLKNRREPVQVTESSIVLYGNCHDYCEEGQEGHDRYPDGPETNRSNLPTRWSISSSTMAIS